MKTTTFTRRKLITKGFKFFAGLLGLISIPSVYTVWGERFWFKVNEVTLTFPDLPKPIDGLRIVHFSDLHVDHFFSSSHIEALVELIQQQKADLICFTGDLMDEDGSNLLPSVAALADLEAPLGKFAVVGNHDYRTDISEVMKALEHTHFQVLMNQHHLFEVHGQKFALAGVDDALRGRPDLAQALDGLDSNVFTILLSHVPDYALITKEYPVHLQLSGHSHGGQIRLPFIGPVLTPRGAKYFVDGHVHVPESHLQLYVNRGVGTTILPVRFLCRPEVTVLNLRRGETASGSFLGRI
ncbi:metallophosphoesterase [Ammoniphilus sp. CFH 90114]|uniref:metallophosphoesterase n=1 Tax=Ammoniphilus sp. CFH 90114 TaxID=2493665 RepID=UPI00100DE548|nr:metallophosphoesterase [Ammoniphilus sp. CFH 90114]RXT06480.1 metallophosphoesterase [Ammoniphilus sp. CFH 90114]